MLKFGNALAALGEAGRSLALSGTRPPSTFVPRAGSMAGGGATPYVVELPQMNLLSLLFSLHTAPLSYRNRSRGSRHPNSVG